MHQPLTANRRPNPPVGTRRMYIGGSFRLGFRAHRFDTRRACRCTIDRFDTAILIVSNIRRLLKKVKSHANGQVLKSRVEHARTLSELKDTTAKLVLALQDRIRLQARIEAMERRFRTGASDIAVGATGAANAGASSCASTPRLSHCTVGLDCI